MSEQDNDRLEQFVRKAVSQPDVPFNEEHWNKLEARLDAHAALKGAARQPAKKLVMSVIILFVASLLMIGKYGVDPKAKLPEVETMVLGNERDAEKPEGAPEENAHADDRRQGLIQTPAESEWDEAPDRSNSAFRSKAKMPTSASLDAAMRSKASDGGWNEPTESSISEEEKTTDVPAATTGRYITEIGSDRIARDFITTSRVAAKRNKQKAKVELPGAEEVKTGEAESVVNEEDVSDQVDHVASPRLSLLLSFAPDFSGTSLSSYSTPGKAFGAMVHYHVSKRWSVAAGVIRNNKQYSGDGEDYQPPSGYWEYYTNGKVPASVYGACDVLEFPVMVQYNLLRSTKHKLLAGAGTSSYLMQSESYQYFFDEPNPGAREGWKARKSSRFLFNMVNVSLGYERMLLPGLALGVEPYVKIPIEEIGWCNLRLFSTGVSVTMRYTLLRKNTFSVTNRSRGPD